MNSTMIRSLSLARRTATRVFLNRRSVQTLPQLPYDINNGLEPVISPQALDLHYNKHHAGYVAKFNNLAKDTQWMTEESLEKIIVGTAKDANSAALFNNAAQIYNHTFFWESMTPGGSQMPAELGDAISNQFGSVEKFQDAFSAYATSLFGSGWTWLVKYGDGSLGIENYSNAGNPLPDGHVPLLTLDVWEHAYYVDHQNRRPDFIKQWWGVVNWEKVAERMKNSA